jgi:hypothetical protein
MPREVATSIGLVLGVFGLAFGAAVVAGLTVRIIL